MNAPNFGSILDKPASAVEKPKPIPQGTYIGIVKGQPRMDASSQKKTEFVEFTIELRQAMEDVDAEELKASLTKADGTSVNLATKTMRATYYLTDDALWRLKKFLIEDLKIEEGTKSLRQLVGEAMGKSVGIFVKHEPSKDGQSVYANIANTLPVE